MWLSRPYGTVCRNPEGWGPVSLVRDFDLTPCFEEGVLFPAVLAVVSFASVIRTIQLRALPEKEHALKRNTRLLWAKVVCIALRVELKYLLIEMAAVVRSCLSLLPGSLFPTRYSQKSSLKMSLSSKLPSSRCSFTLSSYSSHTSTIRGRDALLPLFFFSGQHILVHSWCGRVHASSSVSPEFLSASHCDGLLLVLGL